MQRPGEASPCVRVRAGDVSPPPPATAILGARPAQSPWGCAALRHRVAARSTRAERRWPPALCPRILTTCTGQA